MARSASVEATWEQFDLLIGDGLGKVFNATVLLIGEGHVGKLLEAGDQRTPEAVETVAVGEDGGVLYPVEMAADLLWSVNPVIEVGDEAGNGALEVDVVLPKSIVGVNEQGLSDRLTDDRVWTRGGMLNLGGHKLIIKGLSTRR